MRLLSKSNKKTLFFLFFSTFRAHPKAFISVMGNYFPNYYYLFAKHLTIYREKAYNSKNFKERISKPS